MRRLLRQLAIQVICGFIFTACFCASRAAAQSAGSTQAEPQTPTNNRQSAEPATTAADAKSSDNEDSSDDVETVFPHTTTGRYWISGQANIILQGHGAFRAQYSGPNSLTNWAQSSTTHLLTLYTGYELSQRTEVFADIEDATGSSNGNAGGMAGYVNLDSVRLVEDMPWSKAPYLAQAMLREIIPLTSEQEDADRDEFDLATSLPPRRIEVRLGKFDLTDFIDVNTYGSDSNLQFLNWSVDDNGAYDVASNTRGYTDAVMLEYDDRSWSARFAEALMPKVANGIHLNADLAKSRSENLELEGRGKYIGGRQGVVRLLGYLNEANMGSYRQAIEEYEDGTTSTPDIIATRRQGRHRYGFGLNVEQELKGNVGVFGRLGWSDGHNETFCYTEIDRTVQVGGLAMGSSWRRKNDRAGLAFVMNGIVPAHQQYLALGGLGFLLGDGALTYGREKIVEAFYTAHLWRGFFMSYDFQHANNPGYNQARGPVAVSAFRFHTDF
ncbi:MAG: carbohydrate porin [Terracidiphilus sp.]|jgi:nitrate reductase cytochrome c-type subunit